MARPSADCGSLRGYRQHRRRGDVPCQPCCDASAAVRATYRAKPRADHPLQYRAALAGREPAEALTTRDRARLVAELVDAGWPVADIAAHCRMTTYTTCRIRDRLVAPGVITPPQPHQRTA